MKKSELKEMIREELLKEKGNKNMILEYQNRVGTTTVVIKGKTKGESEILFREIISRDLIKQLEGVKKIILEF